MSVKAFWEDSLRYLYLPRLKERFVLGQAIETGAASRDFFGTAYGQHEGKFDGFQFGSGSVQVDDTLLLIEPEAAAHYEASQVKPAVPQTPGGNGPTPVRSDEKRIISPPPGEPPIVLQTKLRAFHGAADVAPATAKVRMVEIAEEIVAVLVSDPNATVRVIVEISADFPDGAKDTTKRAVSENARSLGLKTADWEQ